MVSGQLFDMSDHSATRQNEMRCILKLVCSTKKLFLDSEKSHVPQILGIYFKFGSIDQRLKIQVKSGKP